MNLLKVAQPVSAAGGSKLGLWRFQTTASSSTAPVLPSPTRRPLPLLPDFLKHSRKLAAFAFLLPPNCVTLPKLPGLALS